MSLQHGGFDISITPGADLTAGQGYVFTSDINIELSNTSGSIFRVYRDSGRALHAELQVGDGAILESCVSDMATTAPLARLRLIVHNEFWTLYINDRWICTLSTIYAKYASPFPRVWVSSYSGSLSAGQLVRRELSDWRDAAWVDFESTAQNAISSIIQQRPVEVYGFFDGTISFCYIPTRSTVNLFHPRNHHIRYADNQALASDTITYYADTLSMAHSDVARDIGFVTRLLRMPDLDNGADRATEVAIRQARERLEMHAVDATYDPRVEMGDIVQISSTLPGTGTPIVERFIVESLEFSYATNGYQMHLEGRTAASSFSPFPRSS